MSGSDEGGASGRLPNTMTPEQCRAGRALIDWSVGDLAAKVGLGEAMVRDYEGRLSDPPSGQIEALRSALATAGVIFTDDGSAGVRLGRRGADEGTRLDSLTTENDR
ncbi:XRE family transcriptional regulator [Methylobacterium sp. C25]|uniref:XRE family transcriptional regulator n=1 Tax=Methylobacterium sp. C25 TaxID=2721622 RepID=UPI001F48B424|nr:XRE family transcriptional regulator [Methylobacterium sp. C25]